MSFHGVIFPTGHAIESSHAPCIFSNRRNSRSERASAALLSLHLCVFQPVSPKRPSIPFCGHVAFSSSLVQSHPPCCFTRVFVFIFKSCECPTTCVLRLEMLKWSAGFQQYATLCCTAVVLYCCTVVLLYFCTSIVLHCCTGTGALLSGCIAGTAGTAGSVVSLLCVPFGVAPLLSHVCTSVSFHLSSYFASGLPSLAMTPSLSLCQRRTPCCLAVGFDRSGKFRSSDGIRRFDHTRLEVSPDSLASS